MDCSNRTSCVVTSNHLGRPAHPITRCTRMSRQPWPQRLSHPWAHAGPYLMRPGPHSRAPVLSHALRPPPSWPHASHTHLVSHPCCIRVSTHERTNARTPTHACRQRPPACPRPFALIQASHHLHQEPRLSSRKAHSPSPSSRRAHSPSPSSCQAHRSCHPVCPSIGPSICHIPSYSVQSRSGLLLSSHLFLCILISGLVSSRLSHSTSCPSVHAHCLRHYASSWGHPSHHMTWHIPRVHHGYTAGTIF